MTTTFDFGFGPVPAHQHPNGGGWVADTATVDSTAYVGPNAMVFDYAKVFHCAVVTGNAKVFDNTMIYGAASIYGNASVFDNAMIYGSAKVFGNASIYGDARVFGNARIYDNAIVFANAEVFDYAYIYGNARIYGNAAVFGNASVFDRVEVFDYARIHGDAVIRGAINVSGFTDINSKSDFPENSNNVQTSENMAAKPVSVFKFDLNQTIYYLMSNKMHSASVLARMVVENFSENAVTSEQAELFHPFGKSGTFYGTCHGVISEDCAFESPEALALHITGKVITDV